ncbi:NAD(P)-dependent oxidoreductase [Haloactinospora alba]|uniref:hypothetical protein n=1 Tax=Haloactinospora alba TaxID=405555 RepID=UPI001B86F4A4|nr:hypothetical protein [Haloactinospora alba]
MNNTSGSGPVGPLPLVSVRAPNRYDPNSPARAAAATGETPGRYRLVGDELVTDARGGSAISMEDFAVALLDEAQHPRHHRSRFTVGY